jgi:hypothetical protein
MWVMDWTWWGQKRSWYMRSELLTTVTMSTVVFPGLGLCRQATLVSDALRAYYVHKALRYRRLCRVPSTIQANNQKPGLYEGSEVNHENTGSWSRLISGNADDAGVPITQPDVSSHKLWLHAQTSNISKKKTFFNGYIRNGYKRERSVM